MGMGHFDKHSKAYSFVRHQYIQMGMMRIELLQLYHSILLPCLSANAKIVDKKRE